ncbi:MIS18-BINDING PROTEIN 1 [Salix viminalis]|uniref:MIS18-BINDING PROTEIN 1 n=1 Tax=Salix viminalis TaxID=40686 RepID=A0A9Q0TAS9_SALVM|nr:MIS18-BINDING PROTEIN 1 [Salix viminalis]
MATAAATSAFQKTVLLHDWWLIKAEQESQGKKIAVAGITSLEKKPVRVFHSAAITKRYDVFTLQTADGVTVLLQGYINRTITVENGFSSQVFRHFCFGFPPDWEECGTKFLNSSCESVAEPPVSQNECRHSFLSRPVDEGVDNLKNDDSKNLSPLSSCHVNDVSWVENSMAVPAEPSDHHVDVALSSGRIGSMKSKSGSFGKLMAKRSSSLDRISIMNDASGERSVHTDYNVGNITRSNFDQILPVRTSGVVLAVSLKESLSLKKKKRENAGNKDGLESGIDFSIPSFPQGPQSGAEANIISPSMEETDTMDANLIDSGHRKSTASLTNLMDIPTQKSVSGHSRKPKRNSGTTLDIAEAMLRASRKMNTLSENSNSKEKKETLAVGKRQARRAIIFDAGIRETTTCIHSPESLSLKRSRSGRLLLPTLDFWRNQIPVYDENRNITGVQEELGVAEPSRGVESMTRKSKRE